MFKTINFKYYIDNSEKFEKFNFIVESLKKELISKGIIKPYKKLSFPELFEYLMEKLFNVYSSEKSNAFNVLREAQIDIFSQKLREDIMEVEENGKNKNTRS